MSYSTINTWFYLSLVAGLGIGTGLMILWARRIYKPMVKQLEGMAQRSGHVSIDAVGVLTSWKMLPGIAMLIICVIPLFYFNNLLKRFDYCQEVVRVNKITSSSDAFLNERCQGLDLNEVLQSARR
jgi:hypothetical protein